MTTEKHKAALDAVEERTENICKIAYDKKLQAEKRRRMIRLECVALTDEVIQALAAHAEAQAVGDDEVREAVIGICRIFDEYGVPFGAARKHLTTLERAATAPKPVAVNLTIQVPQEVIDKLRQIEQGTGTYSGMFKESLVMGAGTMREIAADCLALLQQKGGE